MEGHKSVTNCHGLKMLAKDGKNIRSPNIKRLKEKDE